LAKRRVEQTGSDFGAPIFEHSKVIPVIDRTVAALAALLVKPNDNSSLAAEPSQSAPQLFLVMPRRIKHKPAGAK